MTVEGGAEIPAGFDKPKAKRSDFREYPTIIAFGAIALVVTAAWGSGVNISPMFETAEIRRGELWRLLTSAFPHLDIVHLLANLYWLWEFGQPVERHFGHARTALLLALLAIVSAAYEFALMSGGVGLSGVGYGLFGLLCVLSHRDSRFRNAISRQTIFLFAVWFAFCVLATKVGILPVGNVAHGAGFVMGSLVGLVATSHRHQRLLASVIVGCALFGLWGATLGRPLINLSGTAGYDEARWGYEDLMAHRDSEAVRWLRDASRLQPETAVIWTDLAIAYQRVGDQAAAAIASGHARELEARETTPY